MFPILNQQARALRILTRRLAKLPSQKRRDEIARQYGFADFDTTAKYLQKLRADLAKARRAEARKITACKRNLSFLKSELRDVH